MVDLEKQAQWKKRMADYEASGKSGASWCREQGVSECQFWYWKKKLQRKPEEVKETTWIPVLSKEEPLCSMTIRVGKIEVDVKTGYDEKLLQQVIQTLVTLC